MGVYMMDCLENAGTYTRHQNLEEMWNSTVLTLRQTPGDFITRSSK